MQSLEQILAAKSAEAIDALFGAKIDASSVNFQKTNPQFEGDITLVVFPYTKTAGKSPEETGKLIGEKLQLLSPELISSYNVVKGFLNLSISDTYWKEQFGRIASDKKYGFTPVTEQSPFVMVEYSSPNTNKPLHLGHVRNNLLGYSVSEILKAAGNKVMMVNLVNDRGIHICKSMLAWEKFGNGETPESSGMKGDHLVGKYYVEFDKHNKIEIAELINSGKSKEEAEKSSSLMLAAQEMLRKWEAGDPHVKELWAKMNGWVYDGFAKTYSKLGVHFDKTYYESQTYLLGKEIVEEGLSKNVLVKRDGAVIIDNTDSGLDVKVLLRSDGTSVYMTQDLGTAVERHKEFPFDKHVYVVGNEQDYHFKTLKVCLKKLGYEWSDGLYHLSYGMVELPDGKMKSREGTVVDADELIEEMENSAKQLIDEKSKSETVGEEAGKHAQEIAASEEEKTRLYHQVGMAALKYFILKVDPKKKMLFNPQESIQLTGDTGPFVQYTYARISTILRKADYEVNVNPPMKIEIHEKEKQLIKQLNDFPAAVKEAANTYSPAAIASYAFNLAKLFNQFYDILQVLKEPEAPKRHFRIALIRTVARTLKESMRLLGIEVPERM
jgi:arginyl-tRNA synthetase